MTNPSKPNARSGHSLSKKELRASLILPVVITLIIWAAGLVLYLVTPGEFNTAVGLFISFALLVYLVYWTRNAEKRLRLTAVFMAIPALLGISLGMIRGSVSATLFGVGLTFLLLIFYQVFNTPISYRVAYRRFRAGDMESALDFVDKAIRARPDFWESYQLRALIYLSVLDFSRAERSAKEAIDRQPKAHPVYNTLGQVYLAQAEFARAESVFSQALELDPRNSLYRYHLGLCQLRQEAYLKAAASFMEAIGGSLRFVEYELQAHYYLWRCLLALKDREQAATVRQKMQAFSPGLPLIQARLDDQPDYPHLAALKQDAADLGQQLKTT